MSTDLLAEPLPSRYVVGIDLGTTNSAVCYVDTARAAVAGAGARDSAARRAGAGRGPRHAAVLSLSAAGGAPIPDPRLPDPQHSSSASWPATTAAATPGRLIASAKSWLCHSGVDRTAELLPWHAAADVERLSPVEVSSRYLAHIRAAWNDRFTTEPLERQDVVLTLPASFDEVARELTVQAAARAGLPRVVLIEEPQAAFYAWIYKHQANWEQLVAPGQKILVCDIGGGTTDFTLIRVRRGEDEQGAVSPRGRRRSPDPRRRQSGPGAGAASGRRSCAHRWQASSRGSGTCCCALGAVRRRSNCWPTNAPEQVTITLPGSGSKLIGGGLQDEVTRDEVAASCWSKASCPASRSPTSRPPAAAAFRSSACPMRPMRRSRATWRRF